LIGFTCSGDPLLCAIAKEQHKRSCQLFEGKSPELDLYDGEKLKTGAQYSSETVAISAASFDQTNLLQSGPAGAVDLVVVVSGKSISLPFSAINPYLAYLGMLNMALSFLLAYRIVSRG
jgi:hypothetical protein